MATHSMNEQGAENEDNAQKQPLDLASPLAFFANDKQLSMLEQNIDRALTMVETLRKLNQEISTLQGAFRPVLAQYAAPVAPVIPIRSQSMLSNLIAYFKQRPGEPIRVQELTQQLAGNKGSMRAYLSRLSKGGMLKRVRRNIYVYDPRTP